jgi:intracellular sulfur oxidation DsrE/DsrF family protein
MEGAMKKTVVGVGLVLAVTLGVSTAIWAQGGQGLPVPGVEPARDLPGAKEIPDAKTEYKVLFDVAKAAATPSDVNPMLQAAARYLNTLAKEGVPAEHRKLAVIFHQGGTQAILKNDAYKARNDGRDNPNIAIIQALKKAGVEFRVCGQAVLGMKIDTKDIQPEIQVDLWALTTIVNMELRGYVRIGG